MAEVYGDKYRQQFWKPLFNPFFPKKSPGFIIIIFLFYTLNFTK